MPAYPLIHHHHDVLIVGAGGAGLRAGIAAGEAGLSVACISKVPVTRSHTVAAQGGINAALGNRGADDWRWHMYDTIRGSDWLGDQDAIALMCEQAPQAIAELEHMGMPFTRDASGRIYQRAYGGQKTHFGKGEPAYRACAVADRTGHSLLHTLYAQALRRQAEFFVEMVALDLVFDDADVCRGLIAWQLETGELHLFHAHCVILATGGFGQAYATATASSICTGDGGAMCLRAGLAMQDMEFIQFHPTGLYGSGVLITEGARGEGARLLNGKGERFMLRYAPGSAELASRDVVSRAMEQEILEGRGCGPGRDHLLLDLSHLPPGAVQSKLPSIQDIARTFARLDITRQPVPVLPAVHYMMGGIPTDAHCHVMRPGVPERPVAGLLAVGEAACASVHGANRLGCNALLELVVFGRLAGESAAQHLRRQGLLPGAPHPALPAHATEPALTRLHALRHAGGSRRPNSLRKELQRIMQRHASIFRNRELLEEGRRALSGLWAAMRYDLRVEESSLLWNTDLLEALEADNMLRLSSVSVACALARTESRGAHWRQDYPRRDDARWLRHSLAQIDDAGSVRLSTRPVRMEAQPGSPVFPPEERIY